MELWAPTYNCWRGKTSCTNHLLYHLWPGENIQEITFKFLYLWQVLRASQNSFNHAHHAKWRLQFPHAWGRVLKVLLQMCRGRLFWPKMSNVKQDPPGYVTVYYTLPKTNMVPGAFAVSFKEGNPLKNLGFHPQCIQLYKQGQLVTAQMEEQRFKSSLISNDLIQVLQVFHVYFRYGPTTNMCRALRRKTKQYHCYQEGATPK